MRTSSVRDSSQAPAVKTALAGSDLSGNLTEEYVFFNGRRIAMRNTSTHAVSYYVLDHLGSTSVLADAAGNILNDSDYTPYGGEIPFTTGNPAQHYKFTGKERDSETGNDYFGARYFENTMGRWLSPDWSAKVEPVPYSKLDDPQSLNLYAYVGNNPMMRVDPDGHDGCPHGSGSPSAGCQADQNSCKTNPQQCKAVLDAVSSGHSAANALANYQAQQQNANPRPPNQAGGTSMKSKPAEDHKQSQTQQISNALTKTITSAVNQIKPALEVQERAEFWLTNHALIPAAMVISGGVLAYGGTAATVALCATGAGCLLSPITGGVAVAGVGLAAEGVYYGVTGKIYNPLRSQN